MSESKEEELARREKEILEWAKSYAKEHGWILNPNEKQLMTVIRGLARDETQWGQRFCPCRIWNPYKDTNAVCPCSYHEGEIEHEGHCHCHLFFKPAGDVEHT
jgi:ferredoxin-thioredoxin reductase catalytic chain